ncbi:hypothetical protein AVEN_199896-1 [Araneus ventricosus]|uniref:Uncharacterized protein n=1 Tax=Araneus ventricosus TaxID=182803 RepID=A0A4Y2HNV2_ARAVE|nr:hypothetical protein AVEN_199896-1 [Araneus ventricosus]
MALVVRSRFRDRRVPDLKSDAIEDHAAYVDMLHIKSYVETKYPHVGVVQKFGVGESAQLLPILSDSSAKFEVRPKIALVLLQNLMRILLNLKLHHFFVEFLNKALYNLN